MTTDDFAVLVRGQSRNRPVRARILQFPAQGFCIYPPDGGSADLDLSRVELLGRWDEIAAGHSQTWAQRAAQAYGQVLRQRELVDRLARVGVRRELEPYLLTAGAPNAVMRSLVLNFDELDILLTRAGVPAEIL